MTVIVAQEFNVSDGSGAIVKHVEIASDTMWTDGHIKGENAKKIYVNKDKKFMIGMSGSFHYICSVFNEIEAGKIDLSGEINLVTKILYDHVESIRMSGDNDCNLNCLIANESGLYIVNNLSVIKAVECAIGSGSSVALGSMYCNSNVRMAVLAAIHYADGCGGEIDHYEMDMSTGKLISGGSMRNEK